MDTWQECTLRGITEFRLKYYGNAILMHHQALENARFNFPDAVRVSSERALSKVIISCFNLADCYIALNEINRASDFYLEAQRFLLESGQYTEVLDDFMAARCHALDHLNMAWADFLRQHRDRVCMAKLARFHHGLKMASSQSMIATGLCH